MTYALVFANRHGVGMANLGLQAVYGLLEDLDGARVHRAFADHPRTLEAGRPLGDYDVVALTLPFEGDYAAALSLLAGAGVPLRASDRTKDHPLVIAGGVAPTLNPEPLAPFVDAVVLGEAEVTLPALHRFLDDHRHLAPEDLRLELANARLPGIYVPGRYADGSEHTPLGDAPPRVARLWAPCPWEPARTRILADSDAFGGAYLVEISRGCPHGCRFCAAGHLTRPTRFLPVDRLEPYLQKGAAEAGRVGLVGAAVSDHPGFADLARIVLDAGAGFTVSSFRAENLTDENLDLLVRGGLQTLTVAIEAGTDRMRNFLGKDIGEVDLLRAARLAGEAGLRSLRVYAMVGLPGETDADIDALADLAVAARAEMGRGKVAVSAAPFVPKPHTPFEGEPMATEAVLKKRIRRLQSLCGRHRGVHALAEAPRASRVQGLLSVGGREAAEWLEHAVATGQWRTVLRSDAAKNLLDHPRAARPWGFIDHVPTPEHLARQRAAADRGTPPPTCEPGTCRVCGVCG